jgi:hypothetical protein
MLGLSNNRLRGRASFFAQRSTALSVPYLLHGFQQLFRAILVPVEVGLRSLRIPQTDRAIRGVFGFLGRKFFGEALVYSDCGL